MPFEEREQATMKSNAAVLTEVGKPWEVMEVDVRDPKEGEVLIRYVAAGLCHSDMHLMTGDLPVALPYVGGHEGAGIIEAVGPGVSRVAKGDHVVCAFIPSCGHCRWCSTGRQSLCDMGATILDGHLPDGSYAFTIDGQNAGAMCMLGTFSQYATIREESVVKVDDDLPLEVVVLCGCGVPTGWGSAVNTGNVQIGDTVIIFGVGGIGANAVQGAAHAGATRIIAVDPLPSKGEFAQELGATHAVQSAEEGIALAQENPAGGADVAIVTVDVVSEPVVQAATMAVRKNGTVVLTGLSHPEALTVHLSGADITLNRKHIKGSLFGDCNPAYDIKRMLELYRAGKLKLDELVTKQYKLSEINQGYDDLEAGKNIRGVIIHDG
jgi:alcohol dehydrogenase (nicotinoprotein)